MLPSYVTSLCVLFPLLCNSVQVLNWSVKDYRTKQLTDVFYNGWELHICCIDKKGICSNKFKLHFMTSSNVYPKCDKVTIDQGCEPIYRFTISRYLLGGTFLCVSTENITSPINYKSDALHIFYVVRDTNVTPRPASSDRVSWQGVPRQYCRHNNKAGFENVRLGRHSLVSDLRFWQSTTADLSKSCLLNNKFKNHTKTNVLVNSPTARNTSFTVYVNTTVIKTIGQLILLEPRIGRNFNRYIYYYLTIRLPESEHWSVDCRMFCQNCYEAGKGKLKGREWVERPDTIGIVSTSLNATFRIWYDQKWLQKGFCWLSTLDKYAQVVFYVSTKHKQSRFGIRFRKKISKPKSVNLSSSKVIDCDYKSSLIRIPVMVNNSNLIGSTNKLSVMSCKTFRIVVSLALVTVAILIVCSVIILFILKRKKLSAKRQSQSDTVKHDDPLLENKPCD